MATLKHIASKNSDYTAIDAYLVYQHDAFTGKQLLDEHGRPMLRESYIRALAPDKNWYFDFLARLCHGGTIKGACV